MGHPIRELSTSNRIDEYVKKNPWMGINHESRAPYGYFARSMIRFSLYLALISVSILKELLRVAVHNLVYKALSFFQLLPILC